ncbi:MAG: MazG family protein [Dehalococcoidia bacterium]|nr:MazG family protein [Dehalococcoidia bacterium]
MPEAPEPRSAASTSLDRILAALDLEPWQVQAFDPAYPRFDAQRPLLVLGAQAEAARPLVRERYRPDLEARVIVDGEVRATKVATLPLDAEAWLLPALPPEADTRSIAGLRGVMEFLFSPEGCPWDREQTHATLRPYLLEEAYELVDAIDRDDMPGLREEIGDILAQMFMLTTIADLGGAFTLEDAVQYANEKFVRRHPHVFAGEVAGSAESLNQKWEAIKAEERAAKGEAAEEVPPGALDSTPAAAPSLQRAQSLIRRARRNGLAELPASARDALRDALAREDWAAALWAVAMLAADEGFDAEETLREASSRFTRAFQALEADARSAGEAVESLPAERRLAPWSAVSERLRGTP